MNEQRIVLRQRRDLSEIIQAAIDLYRQNFAPLFIIASVVIPLGIASAIFQDALIDSDTGIALAFVAVTILQLAVSLLVGAALISALAWIDKGQEFTFSTAYDAAFDRFWTLLGAELRALAIVLLLAATIIGLPWAIQRMVRWLFVLQAVILDGTSASDALSKSASAVEGRWWRTFGIVIVIGLITSVPTGLLAGLLTLTPPLVAGTINSAANALVLPFAITAATLLYVDLQVRKESDERTATDTTA